MLRRQNTLKSLVTCEGIGVHLGIPVKIEMLPAPSNTGIVFYRADLSYSQAIKAVWSNVHNTHMCTKIQNADGVSIRTIEHLMAAFYACKIDNCIVNVYGCEIPVMDGSAAPFIACIENVGIHTQNAPRKYLQIQKEISVIMDHNRWIRCIPSIKDTLTIELEINFRQRENFAPQMTVFEGAFDVLKSEYAFARTFGFVKDLKKLHKMGMAKGSSLDNSVGLDQGKFLAKNGLRYPNECVRHKVLDCIGDLYTIGFPILGTVIACNSGHALNNLLVKKIAIETMSYKVVEDNRHVDKKDNVIFYKKTHPSTFKI